MAAGDFYLTDVSSVRRLAYRDATNTQRLVTIYDISLWGSRLSPYPPAGIVIGDEFVLGNFGQSTLNRTAVVAWGDVVSPYWRYGSIAGTYGVKPSGDIRVTGTALQIYIGGAWVSLAAS